MGGFPRIGPDFGSQALLLTLDDFLNFPRSSRFHLDPIHTLYVLHTLQGYRDTSQEASGSGYL